MTRPRCFGGGGINLAALLGWLEVNGETFAKLERADGTPAEWFVVQRRGAELGAWRDDSLRPQDGAVIGVRDDDADEPPVLFIEDAAE